MRNWNVFKTLCWSVRYPFDHSSPASAVLISHHPTLGVHQPDIWSGCDKETTGKETRLRDTPGLDLQRILLQSKSERDQLDRANTCDCNWLVGCTTASYHCN